MGQSSRTRLRLGRISYLNVLPIYYPLESGIIAHPFEIVPGTPACLNGLTADGRLDLSVVSSIEYARHPDRYFIVPDLSISCFGPVKSVLLLSRRPWTELEGESILVSSQSHTSIALLKILFAFQHGMHVRLVPGDCTEALARRDSPAAFLAIGDEALRLKAVEGYPYCCDLGEAWTKWTGLPFVFALWVVQRNTVEKGAGGIPVGIGALTAAKQWGCSHLDTICAEALRKGILGKGELEEYYRLLGYNLDGNERRGLERFFGYLPQIGEVPEAPRLELFSPLASVA